MYWTDWDSSSPSLFAKISARRNAVCSISCWKFWRRPIWMRKPSASMANEPKMASSIIACPLSPLSRLGPFCPLGPLVGWRRNGHNGPNRLNGHNGLNGSGLSGFIPLVPSQVPRRLDVDLGRQRPPWERAAGDVRDPRIAAKQFHGGLPAEHIHILRHRKAVEPVLLGEGLSRVKLHPVGGGAVAQVALEAPLQVHAHGHEGCRDHGDQKTVLDDGLSLGVAR